MVFHAFRKTVKTTKKRRFLPCTVPMLPPESALPRAEKTIGHFAGFRGTARRTDSNSRSRPQTCPGWGNVI